MLCFFQPLFQLLSQSGLEFPASELEAVLQYYHSLGLLFYWPGNRAMGEAVILAVQNMATLLARTTAHYFNVKYVSYVTS